MNLRKSKYWILVIVLVTLISCEKEVKNGIMPKFKQKLVISSFISPRDTVSYVNVDSNRRIYGELNIKETLGNLTAYLSDGTKEIPLMNISSGFIFRPGEMSIEEGKTYNLKVKSDKGLTAESSCKVPLNRTLEIKVDTFSVAAVYPDRYTTKLMASISIQDYPGEDNYYRLYIEQEIYRTYMGQSWNSSYKFTGLKNEFFTDKGSDGKKIEITSIGTSGIETIDSSIFKVFILNTNKEYYDYHESIKKYSGGDDPFTEVSPVYTNISGGLGIFAAYTIDSLIFRLK
jgi:Domain of unknown function (DUF4249)